MCLRDLRDFCHVLESFFFQQKWTHGLFGIFQNTYDFLMFLRDLWDSCQVLRGFLIYFSKKMDSRHFRDIPKYIGFLNVFERFVKFCHVLESFFFQQKRTHCIFWIFQNTYDFLIFLRDYVSLLIVTWSCQMSEAWGYSNIHRIS